VLSVLAVLVGAGGGGCGGPKYPTCDDDGQCSADGKHPDTRFCVDHKCVQCRDDGACGETPRRVCRSGRCEAREGFCDEKSPCPGGQPCTENKCGAAATASAAMVECDDDHPCKGKGQRCQNGHCAGPDPGGPGCRDFGSPTFDFDSPETGTLSYSVSGAQVVKTIRRQTFRTTSVAGTYVGGMFVTGSSCNPTSYNGTSNMLGFMTATQSGAQVSFKVEFLLDGNRPGSCTFTGNYTQKGRLATVTQGTFSCVPTTDLQNAGTFTMTALDAQRNGFNATFSGADQFCTYNGRFGGTRDTAN